MNECTYSTTQLLDHFEVCRVFALQRLAKCLCTLSYFCNNLHLQHKRRPQSKQAVHHSFVLFLGFAWKKERMKERKGGGKKRHAEQKLWLSPPLQKAKTLEGSTATTRSHGKFTQRNPKNQRATWLFPASLLPPRNPSPVSYFTFSFPFLYELTSRRTHLLALALWNLKPHNFATCLYHLSPNYRLHWLPSSFMTRCNYIYLKSVTAYGPSSTSPADDFIMTGHFFTD